MVIPIETPPLLADAMVVRKSAAGKGIISSAIRRGKIRLGLGM
jgi:hypothetical protein